MEWMTDSSLEDFCNGNENTGYYDLSKRVILDLAMLTVI